MENVLSRHTEALELVYIRGGYVECERTGWQSTEPAVQLAIAGTTFAKRRHELIAHFVATRRDRWTKRNQQVVGPSAEFFGHHAYRLSSHAGGSAAPAGMDGGDKRSSPIRNQERHTVRHLHREHETRRVRHHGVRLGTGSEISIGDFPVSQDSHDPAMHLPKSHHLPQIGADRRRRLLPAIVRSVTSQLELSRREHVLRRRFERLATQRLPPRFDAPTKCGIRRWRVPHSAHPTRATAVSIVCSMGKGIGRFTPFSLWHRP